MFNRPIHFILFSLLALSLTSCATSSIYQPAYHAVPIDPVRIAEVHVQFPEPIVPIVELPRPVQELHERARIVMSDAELRCMADNMYYEANGEGDTGMVAVGYVVLNRMATQRYPGTICGVSYQSIVTKKGKRVCQFSWACSPKLMAKKRSNAGYERAQALARAVMLRTVANPIDDSIYFHNRSVRPQFARKPLRATIGNHRFYASL